MSIKEEEINSLLSDSPLDSIWDNLGSETRHGRYIARTQLELIDNLEWINRIETETNSDIVIQASIALARISPALDPKGVINQLNAIDYGGLSSYQQLDLLRAYQLLIIRYAPDEITKAGIRENLTNHYPSASHDHDRELLRVLASTGDIPAIAKTLDLFYLNENETEGFIEQDAIERSEQYGNIISLIKRNSPQTRLLGYLESLSLIRTGWTEEQKD